MQRKSRIGKKRIFRTKLKKQPFSKNQPTFATTSTRATKKRIIPNEDGLNFISRLVSWINSISMFRQFPLFYFFVLYCPQQKSFFEKNTVCILWVLVICVLSKFNIQPKYNYLRKWTQIIFFFKHFLNFFCIFFHRNCEHKWG